MKTKDLKTLIKTIVRECVHEMLAEKYIENSINEMTGRKKQPRNLKETVSLADEEEQYHPAISHNPPPRRAVKEDLASKYGFAPDSEMASIYQDTLENNTYAEGQKGMQNPGEISEAALEKSGIIGKDWSKYF